MAGAEMKHLPFTKPGENRPVPTTEGQLIIESLRIIEATSIMLVTVQGLVYKLIREKLDAEDPDALAICDQLQRRFEDCSGVGCMIAASTLGIDLPPDLQDQEIDYDDD